MYVCVVHRIELNQPRWIKRNSPKLDGSVRNLTELRYIPIEASEIGQKRLESDGTFRNLQMSETGRNHFAKLKGRKMPRGELRRLSALQLRVLEPVFPTRVRTKP